MNGAVVAIYRASHCMRKLGLTGLAQALVLLNRLVFGCFVGSGARIGRRVSLAYGGLGIIVHDKAVIGDDVRIGAHVVIGGRSKMKDVPVIGDRVVIATGAKVLGPIRIGDEAVIGANAVVITDVEARTVVAGVPARVVKRGIDIRRYHDGLPLPESSEATAQLRKAS
jgi:serine O-acetyltransferase